MAYSKKPARKTKRKARAVTFEQATKLHLENRALLKRCAQLEKRNAALNEECAHHAGQVRPFEREAGEAPGLRLRIDELERRNRGLRQLDALQRLDSTEPGWTDKLIDLMAAVDQSWRAADAYHARLERIVAKQ